MSSPGKKMSSASQDLAPFVEPLPLDFASPSEDQGSVSPKPIQAAPEIHPSQGNIPEKVISKAYRFFSSLTVKDLRKIGYAWNLRSHVRKNEIIAECVLYVLNQCEESKGIEDVVGENPHRATLFKVSNFNGNRHTQTPSKGQLRRLTVRSGRIRGSQDDVRKTSLRTRNESQDMIVENEETAIIDPFSLNEYALLCVTLRDHEACRLALINCGKEMSAAALDAKLRRDYFWVNVVQKVFNDVGHKPVLSALLGVLSDVSAELPPPCFRSSEKLKELFRKLRSEFSDPLDRWQRSGQGDPDRFP